MQKYRVFIFPLIILSLVLTYTHVHAAVIDVPAEQPTIQSGIDIAETGDTVLVADGIYRGEGNVNIDFKGIEITVKSQNGAKTTIIDCESNPDSRGFIFQNKETNDSVLDGFTIKNGRHNIGGGIYCNDGSPTIKNCVIAWNKAANRGGGIYCFNSDAKIIASTISNNKAESVFGGGVFIDGNVIIDGVILRETLFHLSLLNCTIADNSGSGVHIQSDASADIRDSKILHNSWGGIMCTFFSRGGTLITNCEIYQNTRGGVSVSEFSIVKITDSIIRQNTARQGGGIYCSPSATVEISNCIIAQNIATRFGGGIGVFDSRWGSGVEISNCTITRNSASESGGGIYVHSQISFKMTGSIVWGNNSDKTHNEMFVTGRGIVIKSNDIRDGIEGIGREPDGDLLIYEDNIDEDPLFVDADRGDYRLHRNSPAKNMGPQTSVVGTLSVVPRGKQLTMWVDIKRR